MIPVYYSPYAVAAHETDTRSPSRPAAAVVAGQWCALCCRTLDVAHTHEPCCNCGALLPMNTLHWCTPIGPRP